MSEAASTTCPVYVDGAILQAVCIEHLGVPIRVIPATVDFITTALVPFTDVSLLMAACTRDHLRTIATNLDEAIQKQLGGIPS